MISNITFSSNPSLHCLKNPARRASDSMATIRCAPSCNSARVKAPAPAPISTTSDDDRQPSTSQHWAIRCAHLASFKKFCPRLFCATLARNKPFERNRSSMFASQSNGQAARVGVAACLFLFCLVLAMRHAIAKAATRLPASAIPRPTRSRAVPWSGEQRTIGNPKVMLTAR